MLTHIHAHTESEEDEKHFMFSISLDIYEYDSNNSIESNIGNTRAYTLLHDFSPHCLISASVFW